MTAGALVLAALYILSDEEEPFSATFTLESLPEVLRKKIEMVSDGMLVTVTRVTKTTGAEQNTFAKGHPFF